MRNTAALSRIAAARSNMPKRSGSKCITFTVLLLAACITALAWAYLLHFSALSTAGLPAAAHKLAGASSSSQTLQASQHRSLQTDAAEQKYWVYTGTDSSPDNSQRCAYSNICDGQRKSADCGVGGLACITAAPLRQAAIKEAMTDSWNTYKQHAWGHDELRILPSQHLSHLDWLHLGLTIVDAMDTLLIMNMSREYQEARRWTIHKLQPTSVPGEISTFETNIRVLGGLLSCYTLGGATDKALLKKAKEVADILMPAFTTHAGVPQLFFHPHSVSIDHLSVGRTNLAAAGSFSLELATISHLTGDSQYVEASNRFWSWLEHLQACDGLYCTWFHAEAGECTGSNWEFSFGASSDSFYEYMLKQWILTHGSDTVMLDRYKAAMAGMRTHLVLSVTPCSKPGRKNEMGASSSSSSGSSARRQLYHNTAHGPTIADNTGRQTSIWEQPFWIVGFGRHNPLRNAQCPVSYRPGAAGSNIISWIANKGKKGWHTRQETGRNLLNSGEPGGHKARRLQAEGEHGSQPAQQAMARQAADVVTGLLHEAAIDHVIVNHHQTEAGTLGVQAQAGVAGRESDTAFAATQALRGDGVQELIAATMDSMQHQPSGLQGQHDGEQDMISATELAMWRNRQDIEDDEDMFSVPASDLAAHQASGGWRTSWFEARERIASEAVTPERRLQHFTCFVPGMLALGHMHKVNTAVSSWKSGKATTRDRPAEARTDDDLLLATKLMRGCYELYRGSVTGVAGDVLIWEDQDVAGETCHAPTYVDTKNYLRPEVVESLFYLWRATHDPVYREWGWQMFRAFYQHSRLPSGAYATLEDAVSGKFEYGDRQESFWLAETLKYFFLLFSDDRELLPLDKWVFNTEAHPLPVWS